MKAKYKCENCGVALLPPAKMDRWDEEKSEVKHVKWVYDHTEKKIVNWKEREYRIYYPVYVVRCPFCHTVLDTYKEGDNDKKRTGLKEYTEAPEEVRL